MILDPHILQKNIILGYRDKYNYSTINPILIDS